MIESLSLKKVATYDEAGVQITDLQKINFIYGVNGSGKTTLTKYIAAPSEPLFNNCAQTWKNALSVKALVYNRDFRDNNFGKGKMDGVFTLGQATKDQTENIEKKVAERLKLKDEWTKKKETLEKQKALKQDQINLFKDAIWVEIYKKHEFEFRDAFTGFMIKENFKNKIIEESKKNTSPLIPYNELKERAKTIFGKVPVNIGLINVLDYSRLVEIEKDKIWQKKIVGKADVDIANLIQRLNINDWINEGKKYIQENDLTCPFCQQETITDDFQDQLANYFDESFIADTNSVRVHAEEYNRLASNLSNILHQIESGEKSNKASKLNIETFSAYLKTYTSQIISNQELLNNKIKEPSRSISLISIKEQLDNLSKLITEANLEINKHNLIVANYAKERQRLIQNIWRFLVEDHKVTIQNFITSQDNSQKAIEGITTSVANLSSQHNNINQEIKTLTKTVTSVQPSVNRINNTLTSYGFHNFSIVSSTVEENKYQIQREDGTIADSTMSEGEITFITFLYFLQLANGSVFEANISDERILVIDDPISSLDSGVLFVVSSLIKEIIKSIKDNKGNIKQLILLTHNVYFHKEVSFVDGRTGSCKETHFWILRRNHKTSAIQSFKTENPIQSSYDLLWAELKNRDKNSALTIQNTMRRIIENYFKLSGKKRDDILISQFPTPDDKEICRSLLCWINDGSHSIPDDLFIQHQEDITDRYFIVFEKIFEYTNHKEHFNMMINNGIN